jgi:hypothetical protein
LFVSEISESGYYFRVRKIFEIHSHVSVSNDIFGPTRCYTSEQSMKGVRNPPIRGLPVPWGANYFCVTIGKIDVSTPARLCCRQCLKRTENNGAAPRIGKLLPIRPVGIMGDAYLLPVRLALFVMALQHCP